VVLFALRLPSLTNKSPLSGVSSSLQNNTLRVRIQQLAYLETSYSCICQPTAETVNASHVSVSIAALYLKSGFLFPKPQYFKLAGGFPAPKLLHQTSFVGSTHCFEGIPT
jgi:hypothetical protein